MKVTDLKLLFEKITFDDFNVTDDSISYKNSLVYGEVSINDIGNIISSQKINFDSMIDVGSGCGKLTIYIALVCNINSEGIEIDKSRFMKSEKLLEFYDLYDKVNFMNGSFEQLYFGNYDLLQIDAEGYDDVIIYNSGIDDFNFKIINYECKNLSEERLSELHKFLKSRNYYIIRWKKSDELALKF